MAFFKITNKVISQIDEFLDSVDLGGVVFYEGINNFILKRKDMFVSNIATIGKLESKADSLRRNIEGILYAHSLLPEFRGDVLNLLEKLDDVIDISKETLDMFSMEQPEIPEFLNANYLLLGDLSNKSVEALVSAARSFFRDVKSVKDKLHRVYYYEKEVDNLAKILKGQIFGEANTIDLSHKLHLRAITHSMMLVSDKAEAVADILSILAIKRIV